MRQRRKANPSRISCAQCDKTFSKTEHLNRHQLAHTGERPYKCSICTKQFARRDVLLRHRRNHTIGSEPNIPHTSPVDPFEQTVACGPGCDPAIDDHDHEILIPTGISDPTGMPEDGYSMTMPLPSLSQSSSGQGDSNTDMLSVLFNSSFEQSLHPLELPGNGPDLSLNHSAPGIFPSAVPFSPNSSISNRGGVDGITSRIQKVWPASPQQSDSNIRPYFWQEIAFGSLDNIFSSCDLAAGVLDPALEMANGINELEISLSDNSKARLRNLKRKLMVCGCSDFLDEIKCGHEYLCINTMEVFEQGLYLYFRRYQPSYPILHSVTFNSEKVSELLLFVMCMIGLSFFKTEDAVDFIRKIYPGILNEVYAQLIFAAADSQTPADLLNYLVLAHHTLFLFISTGGKLCPEKSRSLYLHATATARQYGFFCSRFDQIYDMLFSPQIEERARWIAWTRAESTKNLIIGLVLHDSWLSELFSMNPIIRTDILILPLPQETILYQAPTCQKWSQLLTEIPHANQRLELSSHHFHLPDLQGPIHVFSMYGLLCSVLLRVSTDTRRLILSSDLVPAEQHHYVPWNICRLDKRASIVSPLLVSLVQLYDTTLRQSNPNCIVIWHSVCMLLTADLNLLSRAAGRDGPESMSDARRDLTCWAYTPAARRACLHAAQTFRTLSHRKPADGTAFQSVRTLFMSALILGFYLLGSPAKAYLEGNWNQFDLANSDVDWKIIGDEGISNDGTPSMAPHDPARLEDAAVRFIRFGGPVLIDGKKYEPGARHAQRILLEFAGLLDEVGTHWMANYARLLYMVHDTMAAPYPRS